MKQISESRSLRPLSPALYAVAALLVITPLMQLGTQLGWTLTPTQLQWRAGAVGLMAGAILTPTFGVLVAMVTACVFDHRIGRRTCMVLAALGSVTLLMLVVVFMLDAVQLLAAVQPQLKRAWIGSAAQVAVIYTLTALTLAAISITGFRVGRRRERAVARERQTAPPLVLGTALNR